MTYFILGFICGGIVGIALMATLAARKDDDNE